MDGRERITPISADELLGVYHRLFDFFGPQGWWPGETPLEVMVGAVLTQNTVWKNVEKAVNALKEAGKLDLHALVAMDEERLAELIRPCGYFMVKAKRLRNLLIKVHEVGKGSLEGFLALPTGRLREELLSVSGVGPETADSILLYAAKRPVFVVDAYTKRALVRHGWVDERATYDEIQRFFMERLPEDAALFNEFHALWVALGKNYCRPKPLCRGCPLEGLLSSGEDA